MTQLVESVALAEAVKSALNGHVFSMAVTAVADFEIVLDLKDFKDLKISVIPKGETEAKASRDATVVDARVDVVVQKKLQKTVAAERTAEIAALMVLVAEIKAFIRFRKLPAAPWAVWMSTENNPIFAPDHLAAFNQFTSLLTLTYKLGRSQQA